MVRKRRIFIAHSVCFFQNSFLTSYYESFRSTCMETGQECPWDSESSFLSEATRLSFLGGAVWAVLAYDLVEHYPKLKDRILWIVRKSIEQTPEFWK